MNKSASPWKKILCVAAVSSLLILAGPGMGQEGSYEGDKDTRPAEQPAAPSGPEGKYGITAEKMNEVRTNILNAENSKINKKMSIVVDAQFRYGIYGLTEFPYVLGTSHNGPANSSYDAVQFLLNTGFNFSTRSGTVSAFLNYESPMDNSLNFLQSIGIGNVSYSAGLFGVSYTISAGYGYLSYIISGTPADRPLLAGTLNGQDTTEIVYLFERVPWTEAKDPGPMYQGMFNNQAAELNLDMTSKPIKLPGFGLELTLPGSINASVCAVRDSFNPIVGLTRRIGPVTLGLGYCRNVEDPDLSGEPTYVGSTYEVNLSGSLGAFSFSLDGAYTTSMIHEYIITNHKFLYQDSPKFPFEFSGLKVTEKFGKAILASIWTKKADFLFLGNNQFLLRGFYADPGFDPDLNAVGDVNYRYTDVVVPNDPLVNMNQLRYGSAAGFLADRFDFLSGKVRVMAGAAKDSIMTPSIYKFVSALNSKVLHFTGALYGSDWYGPDGQTPTAYKSVWQQDWLAVGDTYEGSSKVAWDYYNCQEFVSNTSTKAVTANTYRVTGNSKKSFSMLTVDYGIDLATIFDLPVPVFVIGRMQSSATFVNGALDIPFKKTSPEKEVNYFIWSHYIAVPLKSNLVLNGYFGWEHNAHLQPATAPEIDSHAFDTRKLGANEVIARRVFSPFFMALDDSDFGFGVGLDWYIKDGMGCYIKTHFLDRTDNIYNLHMKGYGIRIEFRKYFSYS